MMNKYTYISKENGIKVITNKRLDPKKYRLISEFRNTKMKSNELITK